MTTSDSRGSKKWIFVLFIFIGVPAALFAAWWFKNRGAEPPQAEGGAAKPVTVATPDAAGAPGETAKGGASTPASAASDSALAAAKTAEVTPAKAPATAATPTTAASAAAEKAPAGAVAPSRTKKPDLSDPAQRAALVKKMRDEEDTRKKEAWALAKKMGLEVKGVRPNGEFFELQYFEDGKPVYYTTQDVNAEISSATDQVRSTYPFDVTGSNVIVGIWDGEQPRITHQEFTGSPVQFIYYKNEKGETVKQAISRASGNDAAKEKPVTRGVAHATHVAGIVAAAGIDPAIKGMAPEAGIRAYDWNNDGSEMLAAGAAVAGEVGKLTISNHSYGLDTTFAGTGYFGAYCLDAPKFDETCYLLPYYLPVAAAGNDGRRRKTGFDTLDPYKSAKNLLVVGAITAAVKDGSRSIGDAKLTDFSSCGPTDDGRIRPDIVADGFEVNSCGIDSDTATTVMSGTSMATPAVTGSAALLIDYYGKRFPGRAMRSATLKALIIHTADDMGNAGPDYKYGWGLMNTNAAADVIKNHAENVVNGSIVEDILSSTEKSREHSFTWNGAAPLRVTLCWTDPPGTAKVGEDNREKVLVNDLNLSISAPGGDTLLPYVMPWVGDWTDANLDAKAITGVNTVDNVEQVYVAVPMAGTYTVTVNFTGSLKDDQQDFSLIVSGQSGQIPVGQWVMRQFDGPDDKTGKSIGTIAVDPSGEYRTDNAGLSSAGTLIVSDGQLTMVQLGSGAGITWPIVPLEVDGRVVGYQLRDDKTLIELRAATVALVPPKPKPPRTTPVAAPTPPVAAGPIPVGTWAVRQFDGPDDKVGLAAGTITVEESGNFRAENHGFPWTGTLSVTDGMLTMGDGPFQSTRPIVELKENGKVVGYELRDEKYRTEWRIPSTEIAAVTPTPQPAVAQAAPPKVAESSNFAALFASGTHRTRVKVPQKPAPVPGPVPVGQWVMHQYQGQDDTTGKIIGKITVTASGDYRRDANRKVQTGTLSVANDMLTMVNADGKRSLRPIVKLEQDGKIVGYELSDEKSPIEWLLPTAENAESAPAPTPSPSPEPRPGPIPVGQWVMHQYQGKDDTNGEIIGNITVEKSGAFQCEQGGVTQAGMLSVADDVLTIQFEGGDTGQWPIVPLQRDGSIVGYELSDEEAPMEWLVRTDSPAAAAATADPSSSAEAVPGPIPVGEWVIHQYQGQEDTTGKIIGKIAVNALGDYQSETNGKVQTGTLSVTDGKLTMVTAEGKRASRPIVPLEQDGSILGFDLSNETSRIAWLIPSEEIAAAPTELPQNEEAGQIPVGTWAMREYAGPDDKTGQITGKVTVEPTGAFECERNGELQRGTLSVAAGVLTMQFEGGDTSKWPIAPLQDGDKLVGYQLSDEQNPIAWLVPREPDASRIPVGVWAMYEYAGQEDSEGRMTGKITVEPSGKFQCEQNGETQTGMLSVADDVLTMQFESGDTEQWPFAPLQDGDKLVGYELRNERNPIKWYTATDAEPATEQPAAEQPVTEEPATEEPATEESTTEESTTEESATEESATEPVVSE